jgi:hypothetical protein
MGRSRDSLRTVAAKQAVARLGVGFRLAADACQLTSVDWQYGAGDESRLVGVQEEAGVSDVPAGPHLGAKRDHGVALSANLLAWDVALRRRSPSSTH